MLKISKTKKSFIAISLAAVMALPSNVSASLLDDLSLSNVTSSGSYEDELTGSNYLYGGSVVYKFNKSYAGTPDPLIKISPPSWNAGCDGFSMTGGMLKMLGMDGVVAQLKNASGAVMYGLIAGMIYSMPALKQTFDTIREIGNFLQNFLSDACQAGKALGAAISEKSGLKGGMDSINTAFSDMLDGAQDNKVVKALTEKGSVTLGGVTEDLIGKMESDDGPQENSIKAMNVYKTFEDCIDRFGIASVFLEDEKLSSSSKSIESEKINGGTSKEQLYLLAFSLFGDIKIDPEGSDFLINYDPGLKEYVENGFVSDSSSAFATWWSENLAKLINGNTAQMPSCKAHFVQSSWTAEEAANALVYGDPDGEESADGSTLKLRTAEIAYGRYKPHDLSQSATFFSLKSIDSDEASVPWHGLKEEGSQSVDCAVTEALGDSCTPGEIPIIVPGAQKYINIIAEIEDNRGEVTSQTSHLREMLAEYNAYFYAKYIISNIESSMKSMYASKKNKGSDPQIYGTYMDQFYERKEKIEQQLREMYVTTRYDLEKMIDTFKKVQQEHNREKIGR